MFPSLLQDSFDTIGKTFMKVTAMTTGEIEYTATVIDQLNSTKRGIPLVPFEHSTYIFYYFFILVMPIALVNLLVSVDSLNCVFVRNLTVKYHVEAWVSIWFNPLLPKGDL